MEALPLPSMPLSQPTIVPQPRLYSLCWQPPLWGFHEAACPPATLKFLFALGQLALSPGSFLCHLDLLPITPEHVILRPI